jgi:cyclophilin family peptidyl-prolyl cis-trans isomerase
LIRHQFGRPVLDSGFCEFGSVVDTVECVLAIKRGVRKQEQILLRPSASSSASASTSAT